METSTLLELLAHLTKVLNAQGEVLKTLVEQQTPVYQGTLAPVVSQMDEGLSDMSKTLETLLKEAQVAGQA